MNNLDIPNTPKSFSACTKPIQVSAHFSLTDGDVRTLEGRVKYKKGDVIVTGVDGELWPVPLGNFKEKYSPVLPTFFGQDGRYQKKKHEVSGVVLDAPLEIELSDGRGVLKGNVGSILVQYSPGDVAVIDPVIFYKTYDVI